MGSTFSVQTLLKTPLSYLTGDGDTSSEWVETETSYVLRIAVPSLKKNDSVHATVVDCDTHVLKLRISGEIMGYSPNKSSSFTKFVKLPENGGLFYQASVVGFDGFVVVTVPKVEEV